VRLNVLDAGAGNLHSLLSALEGLDARPESDPLRAIRGDLLLLPGVGNFGHVAARLAPVLSQVRAAIAGGLPVIGVCLGMQLLLERSEEGPGEGLAVIPGAVRAIAARRVPHLGWNDVEGLPDLTIAYFAHSFACEVTDASDVMAWTRHEDLRFPAAVRRGRVVGVQFHPEKSGAAGRDFLRALVREVTR
jgi:glutamine amidotransferase